MKCQLGPEGSGAAGPRLTSGAEREGAGSCRSLLQLLKELQAEGGRAESHSAHLLTRDTIPQSLKTESTRKASQAQSACIRGYGLPKNPRSPFGGQAGHREVDQAPQPYRDAHEDLIHGWTMVPFQMILDQGSLCHQKKGCMTGQEGMR